MSERVLELTRTQPDRLRLARREAQLRDVIVEQRRSCAARAAAGTLIDEQGIVGVTSGPAPLLWLYGDNSASQVQAILASAPEINEVYVESAAAPLCMALTDSGWQVGELLSQIVIDELTPSVTELDDVTLATADSDDMAEIRGVIAKAFSLRGEIIDASYPDDFFTVAAPVQVLVARAEDDRMIGTVMARRQHRSAMVFGLAVEASYRRRGVATALAAAICGGALGEGADFVHCLCGGASAGVFDLVGGRTVGRWAHLLRSH